MGVLWQTFRKERTVITVAAFLLLVYIFIMDVILYRSLQNTKLVDQQKTTSYSPFRPLSIKLLMTAPTNHYIISVTTEYFDEFTRFSKIFYFITPNMISATHLALGFLSGYMVTSESLRRRRLGVLIFECRLWLDVYDGVVYRSHKGLHGYRSNRNNFGFVVDNICDITSGMALCYGVMFYLWKFHGNKQSDVLPLTKNSENGNALLEDKDKQPTHKYPKKYIFYKVLCFGIMMALAGMTFDKTTEALADVFCTKKDTTLAEDLQTEALHSFTTWVVFYCWRLAEAQALLQYCLLAILLDKVWEFLCFVQYSGFAMMILLNLMSQLQIRNVGRFIKTAEYV